MDERQRPQVPVQVHEPAFNSTNTVPENQDDALFDMAFTGALEIAPARQQPIADPQQDEELFNAALQGAEFAVEPKKGIIQKTGEFTEDYVVNPAVRGLMSLNQNLGGAYMMANVPVVGSIEVQAPVMAASEAVKQDFAPRDDIALGMQRIAESETFGSAMKNIVENPSAFANMMVESGVASAPGMVLGSLSGGTALIPTALRALGFGSGSGVVEYGAALTEMLGSRGVDLNDPEAVKAAVRDPNFMREAEERGMKRGAIIGLVDTLSAGFAGKIGNPVAEKLGGGYGARVAGAATEVGAQSLSGAGGEAAAQIATEGAITSPAEVILEGAAEAITGIPEIAMGTEVARPSVQTPPVPDEPVDIPVPLNRDDLADAINNETDLPEQKTVQVSNADIAPELRANGYNAGAKVEQVTEDGEVISGSIAAANIVDGDIEVTVIDENGDLRTLFATDGEITVTDQPATAQTEPVIDQPPAPPVEPEPEPQRTLEQLTQALIQIKGQAKQSGWNKMLTDNARLIRAELDERFPEWDMPKNVDIAEAAAEVNTQPTEAQKEAGNYKKGHFNVNGLNVTIENPQGSERSGKDQNGEAWSVTMPAHYGYIKRTTGADNEQMDVYVGENPSADTVYVVDQIDADTGEFDEHKALIGFANGNDAINAYYSGFSDGRGRDRAGAVTEMTMKQFKEFLNKPASKKPLLFGSDLEGEVKISPTSVRDAYGDELFGYKELRVGDTAVAAADVNILGDEVQIQNIVTRKGQNRKGYAKQLVDDLFTEYPDKTILVSGMTDQGASFFRKYYDVSDDGILTERGQKKPDSKPKAKFNPEGEQAAIDMIGQPLYETLDYDQKGDIAAMAVIYRQSIQSDGKADPIAARVGEGLNIAEELANKYGNTELSDKMIALALSMAKRYGNTKLGDMEAKPSSKLKIDERSLAKLINDAHDFMDAVDAQQQEAMNEADTRADGGSNAEQTGNAEQDEAPIYDGEPLEEQADQAEPNTETDAQDQEDSNDEVAVQETQAEPEQPARAEESVDEVIHNGTRIYKANVRTADGVKEQWAVETADSKRRREAGERYGFGDTLHDTLEEAKAQADLEARQAEDERNREARQQADIDKEAAKKAAIDADDMNGFLADKTPMQRGKIRKNLSTQIRFADDGVLTKRERIERLNSKGILEVSTIEEPKVKPMTSKQLMRSDNAQQAAHEKRMREAGMKTTYLVNGSDLGKVAYDYASHLLGQQSAPDQETQTSTQQQETAVSDNVDDTNAVDIEASDQNTVKNEKPVQSDKIEDFGEKLEGAKKDLWQTYNHSLKEELPSDISQITMAKHFPEPNYEKLIEEGVSIEALATVKALRDMIPNKPRATYKLRRWAGEVKDMRELANSVLEDGDVYEQLRKDAANVPQLNSFFDRIQLYKDLGYPTFTKAKDWTLELASYSYFKGESHNPPIKKYTVRSKKSWGEHFDTREMALKYLKAKLSGQEGQSTERKTKLDIYRVTKTGDIVIGKKVAAGKFIDLQTGFTSSRDAREYLNENYDDLVALLKKKKDVPPVRRSTNDPRIGEDYRNGEDISPERFSSTFGFRGVQFGNYVEQGRRTADLNNAFDALTDMAKIIGIPEQAISLNGRLGLAFGARGSGGINAAAAHYEPGNKVINLTKTQGAGSLGHEWFHAMDNYFGNMNKGEWITSRPYPYDGSEVRDEVLDAVKKVMAAINNTEIRKRSKELDKFRSKDYWSTEIEMSARAFESYLIFKADQKGGRNDYLANLSSQAAFEAVMGEGTYPYALPEELPALVEAFDALFAAIETRVTDEGTAMYSINNRAADSLQSSLLKAAKELKQNKATGDQYLAMLRKTSGIKEEEIAWTGLDEFLSGKKGVSKQDVIDYMNDNQVRIEEVTLGGSGQINQDAVQFEYESIDQNLTKAGVEDKQTEAYLKAWYEDPTKENWSDLVDRLDGFGVEHGSYEDLLTNEYDSETKYEQYTIAGGENYREVLLTLPVDTREDEKRFSEVKSEMSKLENQYGDVPVENREAYGRLKGELMALQDRMSFRIADGDIFKSGHYDQANILAHVRLNDRVDADGNKVLFIEEIQSDWHQAGRKKGYKSNSEIERIEKERRDLEEWAAKNKDADGVRPKEYIEKWQELSDKLIAAQKAVPDAPFKKNWHEMAFRRVVQMAAQNGYDVVAWTPGQVQNERYDLSKTLSKLIYQPSIGRLIGYDLDGEEVLRQTGVRNENLDDYVGKDVAKRLVDMEADTSSGSPNKVIEGEELSIGGEGMKGFYDKILKKYAEKFGKKYGSQVGTRQIDAGKSEKQASSWEMAYTGVSKDVEGMQTVWAMPITESMIQAANEGLELFRMTKQPVTRKSIETLNTLEQQISDRLKTLGFPAANVKLFDDVRDTGLPYADERVEGAFWRGLIYVSMNAKDPISTLDHEVLHALKKAGAFTITEWALLEGKAKEWRNKYKIDETYGDLGLSERQLNEEAIAHAFQDNAQLGMIRRLANKAARFIREIANILRGAPYNFKSHEDVFDAIMAGKVGARLQEQQTESDVSEFPSYSLSKAKKPALDQAKESLARIKGLDSSMTSDLKRLSSLVLHPSQIASLYKEFTPVYRAVIERFKSREVLVHQLGRRVDLYNNLSEESKKKVNAVLEIGRLTGQNFKQSDDLTMKVVNDGVSKAVHSNDGDTIILTRDEAFAYNGVRSAMNMALDKYMETVLEDFGLLELGVKTVQGVEKMRLEAVKEGNIPEMRRFKQVITLLNEIQDAKRKGYIPLKRWGEVGISVKNKGGDVVHFERIELPKRSKKGLLGDNKAVQDALERLQQKYRTTNYDINVFEMSNFADVNANLDLRSLDILAASSDMNDAEYQRLREMLDEEMRKKGFRSHFFRSKDVPGYSEDFERAINDYIVTVSGYISRRMNQRKIDQAIANISASGKKSLFEYAEQYQQYANDPQEEMAVVRQMGFFWYLAGNISSGMVNMTQPFLVTAPWFNAKFSHAKIAAEMTKAYKDAAGLLTFKNGLEMFDFTKAPQDVRNALVQAYEEGDFMSMATNDAMAISNSTTQALRGLEKRKRDAMDAIALTFSIPEKTNRIVTFIAAYRMALDPKNRKKIEAFLKNDNLGKSMMADANTQREFAFAYAEYAVFSTQYRVGKLNRPTLTRGNIGSVMFQFWSFMLQSFELMYKLGKVHGGKNKQSLAAMLLAVVVVAGLKGFPFEDDLQDIIEKLYTFRTGKDLDIETNVREYLVEKTNPMVADMIINGAPYALLNLDMSGRLGFGNVAPDRGADFLGVWWDMLYERPLRAAEYANKGQALRAVGEVAPAFIRNPLQAYIWTEDGIRTQRGSKVIDAGDVKTADAALKFFGFTSADVSRKRDEVWAANRANRAVDDLRSRYYTKIAKAIAERKRLYEEGDKESANALADQVQAIFAEINRYNQTVPLHKRILLHEPTIKQRVLEELQGADARRVRKQARPRVDEIREIYSVE